MGPAEILTVATALIEAAPKLMNLYKEATDGKPVSAADVQAALSLYGVDRAVLQVSIARAEAEGR